MANKRTEAPSQVESAREIHRIRDIIFGPQMRDYEQRFQMLQRDQERLRQEVDHLTEQLSEQAGSQDKKLQSLRGEMRQVDDDLRDELRQTVRGLASDKVDRVSLGELFVELGTHLKLGGSLADVLKDLLAAEQDQQRDSG
jgi:predicted  nucleic acid-binding Zn-ribbon protein